MPAPATIYQSLFEEIRVYGNGNQKDEFTYSSLKRKIRNLKDIDAANAYDLEAILMSHRGSLKQAEDNHKRAIRLSPGSIDKVFNYSVTLRSFGLWQKSLAVIEKDLKNNLFSDRYAYYLLQTYLFCGKIGDASKIAKNYSWNSSLRNKDHYPLVDCAIHTEIFKKNKKISEDDFIKTAKISEIVVREFNQEVHATRHKVTNFSGEEILYVEYGIKAPAEKSVAMSDRLFILLAEDEDIKSWGSIIPSFRTLDSKSIERFHNVNNS